MAPMLAPDALANRICLVTGGGSGLGRAIAKTLSAAGAAVAVLGRRKELLEETVAVLGGRAMHVVADVRDPAAVASAFDAVQAEYGAPVTSLVNNAAGNFSAPADSVSPNGWRAVTGIVLDGTFFCSRELALRLDPTTPGQVVNIVATYGWTGGPGNAHSAAAKGGVINLTKSLAVEWASRNIRVNALAPGPIATEGAGAKLWSTPEAVAAITATIPLGRFAQMEEITAPCAFLISDDASFITGATLVADGGFWLEQRRLG
jgi:NAD(P)-dependent dehydrogenase (short-subunit alcohol dehydrogenase family)